MKLNIFKKGFNHAQDGPGNRLVYHLQGCNMTCAWCSNPEGMESKGSLLVNPELLIDSACPHGAIRHKQIDRQHCVQCVAKECITENRNLGIRLSCETLAIDTLLDEIRRSAPLFFGGGGVTLTGGEPTLQFKAVRALLEKLKAAGIHTALETNATHPKLHELFALIDFLIMDFKHYDDDRSKKVTGTGNAVIKQNLARAIEQRQQVLIRIPLIPGINDSAVDAENFVRFFKPLNTQHAAFEFLTFHEYGKVKWEHCGLNYRFENEHREEHAIDRFEALFKQNKLNVVHT